MNNDLANLLHMEYSPVGVFYLDEKPEGVFEFPAGKRTCVVSMILMAAKGKAVVTCDENCMCAGGAVGLGFGNAFERREHPTRYLLSTGTADMPEDDVCMLPPHMAEGERFFSKPDIADEWKNQIPYGLDIDKHVLFAPQNVWTPEIVPDVVLLLLNPDQISAVVSMGSFRTGQSLQTIAPFSAACQSILHVRSEMDAPDAPMIMGMFDVAQRNKLPADILSITMTYERFAQLSEDAPASCLSSHSWKELVKARRLSG